MAKERAKSLTGKVSNTTLGTVTRAGKFVATLDDNGKESKTHNIRVVSVVGTEFPANISSERIGNLKVMREDLILLDREYVLSNQGSFDANEELGLEASEYAIYRPVAPDTTF